MEAETYRFMYRDRLQRLLIAAWIVFYVLPFAGRFAGIEWMIPAVPLSWIGCLSVSLFMTKRVGSRIAGPIHTTFVALILQFWPLLLMGIGAAMIPNLDVGMEAIHSDDARKWIERRESATLPESASDFYVLDGGNFNGSIIYWSFRCDYVDDCWAALEAFEAPKRDEFEPGKPSKYAVVMEGPSFYQKTATTPEWDVRTIANGVVYERVQGDLRSMRYYAIDFDTCRVYYHYESGGFPADEYPRKPKD